MVMPSGAEAEPGRAGARHGSYVTAGLLFLILGAAQLAWTVRSVTQLHGQEKLTPQGYLLSLVDPSQDAARYFAAEPASVVLAVALIITAFVAFAKRRAARGASVALGFVMLYLTARTLVGLHNGFYRHVYTTGLENQLRLATSALGALFSLIVIIVMLSASEAKEQDAAVLGSGGYGDNPGW